MNHLLLISYVLTRHAVAAGLRRAHLDERGEGVISAAIAASAVAPHREDPP